MVSNVLVLAYLLRLTLDGWEVLQLIFGHDYYSAGAVSQGKNFDEESNASMSTARDETRDGFYMEDGDPSVVQLLHERTFAFSFWPKVGWGQDGVHCFQLR